MINKLLIKIFLKNIYKIQIKFSKQQLKKLFGNFIIGKIYYIRKLNIKI